MQHQPNEFMNGPRFHQGVRRVVLPPRWSSNQPQQSVNTANYQQNHTPAFPGFAMIPGYCLESMSPKMGVPPSLTIVPQFKAFAPQSQRFDGAPVTRSFIPPMFQRVRSPTIPRYPHHQDRSVDSSPKVRGSMY